MNIYIATPISVVDCRYREHCAYHANRNMHLRIGEIYKTYTDGQNEAHFAI